MTQTLFTFGHGYSASALTRVLPEHWTKIGTSRETANIGRITDQGVKALVWPGEDPEPDLRNTTHLLISAAPDQDGDPVLAAFGNRITSMIPNIEWVGYLSTTGVYGDHGGGWVDETTPLSPTTKRGKYRVRAEQQWQALGLPLHIFRLAGIYGPGRGPFAKVRSGKARRIIKKDQVFSRIHVDDVAQVLLASINQPNPGAVYNLCDDMAAPPEDVIAHAARLLGLACPPDEDFETAEMTAMARSFYADSKRVRNDKIKNELGIKLLYPSYQDGLKALLDQEKAALPS